MRTVISEMKSVLKSKAANIHELKLQRKDAPNGCVGGLILARQKYREMHVAYCLLRGRRIDQIEKASNHNKLNQIGVRMVLYRAMESLLENTAPKAGVETVCDRAA